MKKFLFIFFLSFFSFAAWACPGCAGGVNDNKSYNTILILSVFIVLTYIPFYLMYRITKKYDVNKDASLKK